MSGSPCIHDLELLRSQALKALTSDATLRRLQGLWQLLQWRDDHLPKLIALEVRALGHLDAFLARSWAPQRCRPLKASPARLGSVRPAVPYSLHTELLDRDWPGAFSLPWPPSEAR